MSAPAAAVTPSVGADALVDAVSVAVASVDDPEYPEVSIADLGLVESIVVSGAAAEIGLVPTFSGCPALAMIAADVEAAVLVVHGIDDVNVTWLRAPAWSPERVTDRGRAALAHRFTVAVSIGSEPAACPRCGAATEPRSLFGPSRCRSVSVCPSCSETVEVLRG
ncbi:MAG: iron-sulfur cluster assembly protein [Actinomycetota bacterium]